MQKADLIINARWLIPVEPAEQVLEQHSVVIDKGEIIDVAPAEQVLQKYSPGETTELAEHALIPGFINAHTHAAMSLFRGYADDLPLADWLNNHIWPAEAKWVDEDFVRTGTELAIAEMIRGGVTCFNDMYFFPDITARCAERSGMRASVGLIMLDFPTQWAQGPDEYFDKGIRLHDELRHSSLISCCFAPHAPYTVSDGPLKKIRTVADELDLPIHIHTHETAHEVDESVARYQLRPLERLSQLGLLSPRLQAVHMTQLLEPEIEILSSTGVHVVHCPESNMKLASGLCPVRALRQAGVNVALGTDGAASNNDLDMLGEMRSAALLTKAQAGDPIALPASAALAMATLNGAQALGMDGQIGSIIRGKRADLTAINLNDIRTQPVYDPVAQIVYSANRDQVSHVWIDGQCVFSNDQLQTIDTQRLLDQTKEWGVKIATERTH